MVCVRDNDPTNRRKALESGFVQRDRVDQVGAVWGGNGGGKKVGFTGWIVGVPKREGWWNGDQILGDGHDVLECRAEGELKQVEWVKRRVSAHGGIVAAICPIITRI